MMDIVEVEVSSKKLKEAPKRQKSRAKRKGSSTVKTKPLNKRERRRVANVDRVKLVAFVNSKVPTELLEEFFPERVVFWKYLTRDDKLERFVSFASDNYLLLYSKCSTERDKSSQLFLKWLDFVRSLTCKSSLTEETKLILQQSAVGNTTVSDKTQQTVLAIVLNAIFLGLNQQMASVVEEISSVSHNQTDLEVFKPSDEVALHRICGWALKSVYDQLHSKSKRCKETEVHLKQLEVISAIKLPNTDKHLLPVAVLYLDRGGLTFLKPQLWPWMTAIEDRMITHLNQKCYCIYGDKLFEVTV